MSSTKDARKYLELIKTAPAVTRGPHRMFNNPTVDGRPLQALADKIHSAVKQVGEQRFEAPSPWHAAAWLLDVAALAGQRAQRDAKGLVYYPYKVEMGAPVFRGQRHPDWKFAPSLYRPPCTHADLAALEIFISAVSKMFELFAEDSRMESRHAHMAAAQHYGMPTPLLDFTADPRIAVYFACENASSGDKVVAYGTPFNAMSQVAGAVVFAPPWVRRLYAQRGLFLDCSDLGPEVDFRDFCFRMEFPADEEYARGMFPAGSEALLPKDPWYEKAIRWAQDRSRGDPRPASRASLAKALHDDCGTPPFMCDAMLPNAMREALDGFVDILEWLALKASNGGLAYDCEAIVAMWRHNEPLFRSHRVVSRIFANLIGPKATAHPMLAALDAVGRCIEPQNPPG